jgi:hypothetical protein
MRFLIYGLVVAERLPERAQIGPALIERLSPTHLKQIQKSRPLIEHITDGFENMFSVRPPDVLVRSHWRISFEIDAPNEGAAYREAVEKYLPTIYGALGSVSEAPVVVDLVRIVPESLRGSSVSPRSPWSLPVTFRGYVVQSLDGEALDRVKLRAEACLKPECLEVSRHFAEARHLSLISSGLAPVIAAALLRFFHVIEAVARHIARGPDDEQELDRRREVKLESLRRSLNKKASLRQHIAQIRNAAREFDRIELQFLSQRIERTCEILGLDEKIESQALELAKLRNRKLSHAAPGAEDMRLEPWLDRAEATAREFLVAFLDRE